MHKIDTDTAVGNEFIDGNAAAGVRATRLNASWFNTIQRELSNIVQKAGIALSDNDDEQVLAAILLHAVAEILGGKSHKGALKLSEKDGVGAVLRDIGIWFENVDSGVHVYVTDDGFGFHYVDENGDTIEVELRRNGLRLGNDYQIVRGNGFLKSLRLSDFVKIDHDGELTMAGVFSVNAGGFAAKTDFNVGDNVKILTNGNVETAGSVRANVVSASKSVHGPVFCSQIFDATTEGLLSNPASLLAGVTYAGATALVRNMSGSNYVLHRVVSGNQYTDFVVEPGEILQFVYDGSKWVHSW